GDTAGGSRPDRCEGYWSGAGLPRPGDQAPDAVPRARCGVRRSSIPDSRARRASVAPADPNRDLPSDRTPADAKASRNIRVPWTYLSLLSARVVVAVRARELHKSVPWLRQNDDCHDTTRAARRNAALG